MIVCLCHRVSDRDIVQAVRDGAPCFEAVQAETGTATGCGRCRDCARAIYDGARSTHSAPALSLGPALAAAPCGCA
jgi:bacterioferritin-associated ferredoxin